MEDYLRVDVPITDSSLCKDDVRAWEETAQRWTRLLAIDVVSNETKKQIVLVTTSHTDNLECQVLSSLKCNPQV